MRLESLAVNGADPVTYTYDDDSLLLAAGALGLSLDPDSGRPDSATLDQVTTEWTYTPFGELESMTTRHGGTVIFEESFVYDKRGWITDLTRTQGGNTVLETYGYDASGRLETVHQDGQPRSSYTYDLLGWKEGCPHLIRHPESSLVFTILILGQRSGSSLARTHFLCLEQINDTSPFLVRVSYGRKPKISCRYWSWLWCYGG